MKKTLATLVGFTLLGAAGFALAGTTPITLRPDGPQPRTVTVPWGDTVSFQNADALSHAITLPRINVEGPSIPPGGSWAHVFDGRGGNYLFRQLGGPANHQGTIVVDVEGKATLTASSSSVPFGKTVTLRGTSTLPGFPVKIVLRVLGEASEWTDVNTLTAGADGSFSTTVQPKFGARYRASVAADQIFSASVFVGVRPLVSMKVGSRRVRTGTSMTITGRVTPADAATSASLERFDARRKSWGTEATVKVRAGGRLVFKWKAKAGTSPLRVSLRRTALRPGWDATASRSVAVTGVG